MHFILCRKDVVTMPTEVTLTKTADIHCVQKKTPTHIFFRISMNDA